MELLLLPDCSSSSSNSCSSSSSSNNNNNNNNKKIQNEKNKLEIKLTKKCSEDTKYLIEPSGSERSIAGNAFQNRS